MSSCLPACFLSRANSHFPEIACCGENSAVTRSPYNKTRFDAVGPDCGTCRPFQKKTCSGFLLPGHLKAQRHKDICRFAGVCLSGSRISLSSTAKNSRQMQTAKLQLRPKWKTSPQHAATSRIRWQMMPAQKTNPLPHHLDAFLVWRPLVLRVPVSPSRGCRAALVKADEDSDSAAVDAGLPILMDLMLCRCNPKPIQW